MPLRSMQRLPSACRLPFARGAGHGLLQLGAREVGTALTRRVFLLAGPRRVMHCTLHHTGISSDVRRRLAEAVAPPPDAELEWLAMAPPLMTGAEYLTRAVLRALWQETDKALRLELSERSAGCRSLAFRSFSRAQSGVESGRTGLLQSGGKP